MSANSLLRSFGPRSSETGEVPAQEPPAPSELAPSAGAKVGAIVLLAVALLIAIVVTKKPSTFEASEAFVLFAGFYVAAQAIERLCEFLLPTGDGTTQASADRKMWIGGIATILGVLASLAFGLYLLKAIGLEEGGTWLDVAITGLVIGAGTKPLHDLITRIQPTK